MKKLRQSGGRKVACVFAVLISIVGLVAVAVVYYFPALKVDKPMGEMTECVEAVVQEPVEPDTVVEESEQEFTEIVTETEESPERIEITISAVGDVTFGRHQRMTYENSFDEYYDNFGAEYFFQNVEGVFEADDFTIANLEGPLTDADTMRESKEWIHTGRPKYAQILTEASIEAVSLGNNHIMDYNSTGVSDTEKNLDKVGVEYAISGAWGDKYGMYETKKGIKIGFASVNEYYEGSAVYPFLEDGLTQLREAGADLVFACIHWGEDKVYEIEENQYEMGPWCIDRGYDLVLGCHSHLLQGIECYNGKYIVYGMGNFCYGGNRNPSDKRTMIFQQTFTFEDGELLESEDGVRIIPCRLSSVTDKNDYCPVILDKEEAADVMLHLNQYSEEFGIVFDEKGERRW